MTTKYTFTYTTVAQDAEHRDILKHDTCGEASLFMTLGEFDIEVSDQSVDIIVSLDLQTEGGGEGQFLWLHRVDVHFLRKDEESLKVLFHGLINLMTFSAGFLLKE